MSNSNKEVVDAAASSDPLDLEKLRISPEMMEGTAVRKLLTAVPVRKPNGQDFVRCRREPQYRETLALIELREERETYVIDLNAVPDLRGEVFFATCFTAITRGGTLFLWPVKRPATDGKTLEWHTSAAMAAQYAMKGWIRYQVRHVGRRVCGLRGRRQHPRPGMARSHVQGDRWPGLQGPRG